MFSFEADGTTIVKQSKVLEDALSSNPKTQTELRKLIQKVLKEARAELVSAVKSKVPNDPRGAVHSIRRIVYKRILGANLNIFNMKRKAGTPTSYEPPRTLRPGQRGGNRVKRSERTQQVMSYGPHDRGFILRFLNSGTQRRTAGSRGGALSGNRGSLTARNFFGPAGDRVMADAAVKLSELVETEIAKMLNK